MNSLPVISPHVMIDGTNEQLWLTIQMLNIDAEVCELGSGRWPLSTAHLCFCRGCSDWSVVWCRTGQGQRCPEASGGRRQTPGWPAQQTASCCCKTHEQIYYIQKLCSVMEQTFVESRVYLVEYNFVMKTWTFYIHFMTNTKFVLIKKSEAYVINIH